LCFSVFCSTNKLVLVRTQTPYTIKDVSKSLLKYRKRLNVKLTSTIGNKKDTLKAVYFGKNKINDYIKLILHKNNIIKV